MATPGRVNKPKSEIDEKMKKPIQFFFIFCDNWNDATWVNKLAAGDEHCLPGTGLLGRIMKQVRVNKPDPEIQGGGDIY